MVTPSRRIGSKRRSWKRGEVSHGLGGWLVTRESRRPSVGHCRWPRPPLVRGRRRVPAGRRDSGGVWVGGGGGVGEGDGGAPGWGAASCCRGRTWTAGMRRAAGWTCRPAHHDHPNLDQTDDPPHQSLACHSLLASRAFQSTIEHAMTCLRN